MDWYEPKMETFRNLLLEVVPPGGVCRKRWHEGILGHMQDGSVDAFESHAVTYTELEAIPLQRLRASCT